MNCLQLFPGKYRRKALHILCLLLVITSIAITALSIQSKLALAFANKHSLAANMYTNASGSGIPYVSGAQIIDASGNNLVLHGAQIASAFNTFSAWKDNYNHLDNLPGIIGNKLNPTVFNQMSTIWHMNALRLPTSNWIYTNIHFQTLYVQLLDQVVQEANQAGLYVIVAKTLTR